ncbi:MAG: protein-glutamate O-methyltransferase CheR [Elusimicrobia bacterium]|nr:protein-glutamate O-methyltransferase CheR [Candidatus Liberimonas magnetica]
MGPTAEEYYFNKLLDLIHKRLSINCRQYNEAYIKRRINARISANDLELDNYNAYIKILEKNPEELRYLFDALTINVTKFFRDIKIWKYIQNNVLPIIIREKNTSYNKSISVWSCGCSSGEEPYSIAVLLSELYEKHNYKIYITATDIDETSLLKARNGIYSTESMTEIPKEYINKYFTKIENIGLYKINDKIKNQVIFKRKDVFGGEVFCNTFDIVLCRNMLIYFNAQAKEKLVNIFHKSLVENGWLIIGESEILFERHLKNKLYFYDEKERIYRKERRNEQEKTDQEKRNRWWHGYPPKS